MKSSSNFRYGKTVSTKYSQNVKAEIAGFYCIKLILNTRFFAQYWPENGYRFW